MSLDNSNAWLITNSQMHFSNTLLNNKLTDGIDVYGLIDLSNLLQSIVLSDKLVTLPGNEDNVIKKDLKKKGLLETLQIDRTMDTIFTEIKGKWNNSHLLNFLTQNQEVIADRIMDTISVDKNKVIDSIKDANMFADIYYNTPDHDYGGNFTYQNCSIVDLGIPPALTNYRNNYEERQIKEIYVGSLLYFMTASKYSLNYSPDSIRIPLTAFLINEIDNRILKLSHSLINQFNERINEEVKNIYDIFYNSNFSIEIPSIFASIIKTSKNKGELIDKAINLRNEDETKKYRIWIKDLTTANSRIEISEKIEIFKNVIYSQNTSKLDKAKKIGSLGISGISITFGDILTALGSLEKVGEMALDILPNYFKTRKLVFLRNLKKNLDEIISMDDDIKRIFGTTVLQQDIEFYKQLNAYTDNYLSDLLFKKSM